MYKLMSPGPTQVPESVRQARSRICPNPDTDPDFLSFYRNTCRRISRLLGDDTHETLVLGGEGILGLEAACASLTEPGDRVLVLDNGLFGAGFADFVSLYGGIPERYTCDYRSPIDPGKLRVYLSAHPGYKYATLVHCDTPSGILNDLSRLCPVLKEFGLLTVVDSVAAMFGEELDLTWGIDILCGGSQKAISAPPGLALVTISLAAWAAMKARKVPVASFYANLLAFSDYYESKWFPYTMPVSDLYGLAAALDLIEADPRYISRHADMAAACRGALVEAGLCLYPESGFSGTVTAFCVPDGVTDSDILAKLLDEHNILLSGSFGLFAGKLIRIGHMGSNCNRADMEETMTALGLTLQSLKIPLNCDLGAAFRRQLTADQ